MEDSALPTRQAGLASSPTSSEYFHDVMTPGVSETEMSSAFSDVDSAAEWSPDEL
ncbi:hypothetical protein BJY59DRAFT_713634 [Rhodotorula toruloides]